MSNSFNQLTFKNHGTAQHRQSSGPFEIKGTILCPDFNCLPICEMYNFHKQNRDSFGLCYVYDVCLSVCLFSVLFVCFAVIGLFCVWVGVCLFSFKKHCESVILR